jgi:RNA polymerase sigma-70 factor (ECF subfamily)
MNVVTDDAALMSQIAQAHSAALSELYDRYGRMVFSLAFRITGSSETAEEVTQDVFVQVWRFAEHYDPQQGKLTTWLNSVTRNRAIDILRQQNVRPEGHADSMDDDLFSFNDPAGEAAVEPSVELRMQQEQVRQALEQLPEEQRQALALAYFMGMTQQEIAEELNQPLGTVKTRIRLGMIKLKDLLG